MSLAYHTQQESRHMLNTLDCSDLSDIYREEINLIHWQRPLAADTIRAASVLTEQRQHLNLREQLKVSDIERALIRHLGDDQQIMPLIEDIHWLADMFAYLFDIKEVGLRLETADRATCPRFHVDKVVCRMVTTFQGPGTEWLENQYVDRSKLGRGSQGLSDETSGLLLPSATIQRAQTGAVVLLKGESWFGNENQGAVHRSPAVTTGTRLVMTLDIL